MSLIRFLLLRPWVSVVLLVLLVGWGAVTAPFPWALGPLPRDPVPVDAIPDLGDNQQIVYTEWAGRSPQDIDNQITYPLTTALLGIPGVKTVRSSSIFGLSSIYLVFDEGVDFYWSRSRILEKLNALPYGTLPPGVRPALGPDATALGQVFWYTIEGLDTAGQPTGGWDPQELRTVQDFYVKYGLAATKGVAEVASVGGYVKEYQIDIDPVAMKGYGVTVADVMQAVQASNLDAGARTIEFNRVEYVVRGLGYVQQVADLEQAVLAAPGNVPVRIGDVAIVQVGPATRRGGLDKDGIEAVGGVVVARYGANPMAVIERVKQKIKQLAPGMPEKVLANGTTSKLTIVPFYDRSGLIQETLGTLEEALTLEVLVSILVVVALVLNTRASLLISGLLPAGVLITFVAMRYTGVQANIVALAGIAIAIGVMVDVGVVLTENIVRHLQLPGNQNLSKAQRQAVVLTAVAEVAPAVLTALATTVISFLPVFFLEGQEGRLFRPLAYAKTFALLAAAFIGLVLLPPVAARLLGSRPLLRMPLSWRWVKPVGNALVLLAVVCLLGRAWLPLGAGAALALNILFVAMLVGGILGLLWLLVRYYPQLLGWALAHKRTFLLLPLGLTGFGLLAWLGAERLLGGIVPEQSAARQTALWQAVARTFPGTGQEFMPPLDEGAYLLMPTTMPHAGVAENISTIRQLDARVAAIPEVAMTVGKWGRVASALDPAPIGMFENVINYKPEYLLDAAGHRRRFQTDEHGRYVLANGGTFDPATDALAGFDTHLLVPHRHGSYFRQWRPEIRTPDDIWQQVVAAADLPGMTSAPKLQPIATRLVMLSTGMRAPMGMKIYGPNLATLETTGQQMEALLQQVPGIAPQSVFADRVVGKPYLQIEINRQAIARYGLSIADMQTYLGVAIGGNPLTTTVEGRERYPVRVRYARELRDSPEAIAQILIPTPGGVQVPLQQLATITYQRGPQNIKSEDTFLVSYVIFDKQPGYAETDVVNNAKAYLEAQLAAGSLQLPAGVSYRFAGNYEHQQRAASRLAIIIPLCLLAIVALLYFQFGQLPLTLMSCTGIVVAFAGGFIGLWLYGQPWFLDLTLVGQPMRTLFQVGTVNLSVAVWVGFIALFGIATDDGVLMGTRLKQHFAQLPAPLQAVTEVRQAVLAAARQRVRPAVMTTATTLIALLPVLTATGKGADMMLPMAVPIFGGMLVQAITMFVVPVLYCWQQEAALTKTTETEAS